MNYILTGVSSEQKMDYRIHIKAGAAESYLPVLIELKKREQSFVGYELYSTRELFSKRRKITSRSLLYCYFYRMCSDKLYSLVPAAISFPTVTIHATYTIVNHSDSLRIPLVRRKFHSFLFYMTDSRHFSTILTSSNLGLNVFFHT